MKRNGLLGLTACLLASESIMTPSPRQLFAGTQGKTGIIMTLRLKNFKS